MINIKKIFYILLASILGMLIYYDIWLILSNLPPKIQPLLLIFVGGLIGIDWGFRWWRLVYTEHRRWPKSNKKNND